VAASIADLNSLPAVFQNVLSSTHLDFPLAKTTLSTDVADSFDLHDEVREGGEFREINARQTLVSRLALAQRMPFPGSCVLR
jgi:hypothetical protein